MVRTLVATAIVLAMGLWASAREASPIRAAQPVDGQKAAPENRGKIIEELKSDYGDVVDKLDKNNLSEQLRARQQRIVENLKKLLEDDDNPPPPPSSDAAPMPPPEGAENRQPKPPAPNAEPRPEKTRAPQPKNVHGDPKASKLPVDGNKGERDSRPKTAEELQKDSAQSRGWGDYPKRLRPEMEAFSRERFPQRYEDLLRAYYRNLAESDRREGNE